MKQLDPYSDKLTSYGRYFSEIAVTARGSAEAKQAENMINALYKRIQDAFSLNGYSAVLMPTPATSVSQPTSTQTQRGLGPHSSLESPELEPGCVFRSAQPPMTMQPRCELLRPLAQRLRTLHGKAVP